MIGHTNGQTSRNRYKYTWFPCKYKIKMKMKIYTGSNECHKAFDNV